MLRNFKNTQKQECKKKRFICKLKQAIIEISYTQTHVWCEVVSKICYVK
jgi:hypothetical protein